MTRYEMQWTLGLLLVGAIGGAWCISQSRGAEPRGAIGPSRDQTTVLRNPTPAGGDQLRNDGSDASKPVLADEDGTGDTPIGEVRLGVLGWADRCYRHILGTCKNHRGAPRLGYAKAECSRAMSMNPDSPNPRASILYNMGLIERGAHNRDRAREFFEQSLALRPNDEVQRAFDQLASTP